MPKKQNRILITALLILLPFVFLLASICVGRYTVGFGDVFRCLWTALTGVDTGMSPEIVSLVVNLRLMRSVQGILVGATLAVSGAAFQSLFRNPLVSSGMLGVSSGAGFGAALAIVFFGSMAMTVFFSFSFGILAVALAYLAGKVSGGTPMITLVLGGTIIQSVFAALLALLKYVADPYTQLPAITFWIMGSFASTRASALAFAAVPMVIGIVGIVVMRWRLNVLSMGDREAHTLGINVGFNKFVVIALASLATAAAVCVSGVIGWIGLVVPHICRMLVGSDNRYLVPASISIGGCFTIFVDTLCRTVTGGEIPLGIVTAIVGGPFFIYLLKRTKGRSW